LSFSLDGRYLATGEVRTNVSTYVVCVIVEQCSQCGHDPKVRVWDLTADRTVCIELGDHKFAIDCVVRMFDEYQLTIISSSLDSRH
jgi:hypothetical protein